MTLSVLWRTLLLYLALALPGMLVVAALGHPRGILIWAAAAALGLLFLSYVAAGLLARAYRCTWSHPVGLPKTLEMACAPTALAVPKVGLFANASPIAIAIKSFGKPGIVLVSQGLLNLLPEEQLRAVFRRCAQEVSRPGLALDTVSALLSYGLLRASPRQWSMQWSQWPTMTHPQEPTTGGRIPFLTPISTLGFLLVSPVIRFLLNLSRRPVSQRETMEPELEDAMRFADSHMLEHGNAAAHLSTSSLFVVPNTRVG